MKKIIYLLSSLLLLSFISCKTSVDTPSEQNPSYDKIKLNIADASQIYIGGLNIPNGRAVDSSPKVVSKLFKITKDGVLEEVTYKDETGETEIKNLVPNKMMKLNSLYILISFESGSNYLVNTKTGDAYKFTEELPDVKAPVGNVYYYDLFSDKFNNVYYMTFCDGRVKKLDVTDPNNVFVKVMTPSVHNIWDFAADKEGNIIYMGTDSSGSEIVFNRNLDGSSRQISNWGRPVWQGGDGYVYASTYNLTNENGSGQFAILRYNFASENPVEILTKEPYGNSEYYSIGDATNLIISPKESVVIDSTGVCIVNNETQSIKYKKLSDIGLLATKCQVDTSFNGSTYIAVTLKNGKSGIVSLNTADFSTNEILSDGKYDIYKLSNDGKNLIFNALRLSDSAIVIGKIYLSDNNRVEILEENLNKEIKYLEKIN